MRIINIRSERAKHRKDRDALCNPSSLDSQIESSQCMSTEDFRSAEDATYKHLSFMLSIIEKPAAQLHLTVGFLVNVFALQNIGSPRIARVCLLLASCVLTCSIIDYEIHSLRFQTNA